MAFDLPPHEAFMLPILKELKALGGSATIEEINTRLVERFGFTPEQMEISYETTGALVIPDRMSWARSYLKYPGFVENPKRGVWVLTETGRTASDWDEADIRRAVNKAYAEKHSARKAASSPPFADPGASGPAAPDTSVDAAPDNAEGWADRLLARVQTMDPAAFERLCQRLLREHGFTQVTVTGKSGDGGIDGTGVLRVNLLSFHVLFQCKRWKGSVSSSTIRDFRGAMQGRADKGLVITTGTFTPDARREATRDGAPAIDLIDGEALCDLLRERELGVRVRPITTYEIVVDEEFFTEI